MGLGDDEDERELEELEELVDELELEPEPLLELGQEVGGILFLLTGTVEGYEDALIVLFDKFHIYIFRSDLLVPLCAPGRVWLFTLP